MNQKTVPKFSEFTPIWKLHKKAPIKREIVFTEFTPIWKLERRE